MVKRFSRRGSGVRRDMGPLFYQNLSAFACVVAGLLLTAAPLAAQTYSLSPAGYQTVLNNSGDKVSNACVWTYAAGTTTPIATYSDASGTPNPNPIRTDPAGRFTAYLIPGTGYKFVFEQPCTPPGHGVVLKTADNIAGTPSASVVTTGTWIPSLGGTTTYSTQEGTYVRVGALVFARGYLAINTIGTGAINSINGLPFPAVGITPVNVSVFQSLFTAVVWIGGYITGGGTSMTLVALPAAGTGMAFVTLFGNGTSLAVSVVYQTGAP